MNTEEQKRFYQFVEFLRQAKSDDELAVLLRALLTPAELHDIPNRLLITQLLRKGVPQRDIAKQLGVGIATVTRGSKALSELATLLETPDEHSKAR